MDTCLNRVYSTAFLMVQGMLSGGQAGLVSIDILRKEQEENRRREKHNKPLEGMGLFSCYSNRLHCQFH